MTYLDIEIANEHCDCENCNGCPLWGKDDCYIMVEDYRRKVAESNG